jgi:hypothetical protein
MTDQIKGKPFKGEERSRRIAMDEALEHLPPQEAAQAIDSLSKRKGAKSAQRIAQELGKDQDQDQHQPAPWEVPTPTSLRRERSRRPLGQGRRDARRPGEGLASRPVRDLTDEERRAIEEYSRSLVVVSAEEHRVHKRYGGNQHGILSHVPGRRGH